MLPGQRKNNDIGRVRSTPQYTAVYRSTLVHLEKRLANYRFYWKKNKLIPAVVAEEEAVVSTAVVVVSAAFLVVPASFVVVSAVVVVVASAGVVVVSSVMYITRYYADLRVYLT